MPYQYKPGTENKFRKKKGYKGAYWVGPEAFKAQLGERYDPLAEEFYNRGLVEDIDELKAQLSTEEGRNNLLEQAKRQDRGFFERAKDWFKESPHAGWVFGPITGLAVEATGSFPKLGEGIKEGYGKVKEAITKEAPEELLRQQQRDFIQEMLGVARKGIPQQIQRLEQQRQTPYLEQAFGQVGGPVAGGLGATLLGQLAQSPGSEFTSGEFQGTSPLSGKLLGSLLSSLAVQGATKYGPGLYEQYGPQVAEYGRQGLQYGQQQGRSALDYLRGLLPQ